MLLENRYDLRLAESGLAHEGFLSAILAWKPTVSNGPVYRGNVAGRTRFQRINGVFFILLSLVLFWMGVFGLKPAP
jgi:hypothetical protein